MKHLLLALFVLAAFATGPDVLRPGAIAWADDGDGDGGDGGDGDGSDGGDGDGGDGGDGDGGDGGDGDGGDGGNGDNGDDGDNGASDNDDADDGNQGASSAATSSGGGQNGSGARSDAGGDPLSDLIDLIFGPDRPSIPNELLVLTPAGQVPPDLTALQANGFAVLEDETLSALQAGLLRLSVPPGLDLDAAAEIIRNLAPASTVDLNDLYERAGSGCANDCWGAELVALGDLGRASCRRGAPIAMIDTAVQLDHPALRAARIETRSFRRVGVNAAPRDHGTAIAALLVGENAPDATPLAPDAKLLAAEAIGMIDDRPQADTVALIRALDWTMRSRARVIALSLAGHANATLHFAIRAVTQRANVVAAAGNDGARGQPAFPAAYPEVMAVAAVDRRLRPYRSGTRGDYVELSAPGVDVTSASADGDVGLFTGTSFAVPFAVAATLRARAQTDGDPQAARRLLIANARDLGAQGHDEVYGFGLIQAPGDACW